MHYQIKNYLKHTLIVLINLSLFSCTNLHEEHKVIVDNTSALPTDSIENDIDRDSSFTVYSLPFTINGLRCRCHYLVISKKKKNNKEVIYTQTQQLFEIKTNKELMHLNQDFFQYLSPITTINGLTSDSLYFEDVNSDGLYDYKFVSEIAAAGTNTAYSVFLFNNKTQLFQHSELFSGYNIEFDAKKRRISSFAKAGWGHYFYQYKNLSKYIDKIDFLEKIQVHSDTILYTKTRNEKVVKQLKIVASQDSLDIENLLERNKCTK